MTVLINLKRLSNPRVRRRLKIGLSVWFGVMLWGFSYKIVYDIAYFDAKALENNKNAVKNPVLSEKLTLESAQHLVTRALNEDPSNLKTIVNEVIADDNKLSTLIITTNNQREIAWIIDKRLFFKADVFNQESYNLTKGYEQHYQIKHEGELPAATVAP
jgi:hypothetical protein